MASRCIRDSVIAAVAVAAGLVLTPLAEAQYETPAGAAAAPRSQASPVATPRLANGKPDLSGFWGGGGGGGAARPDAEGNLTVLNVSRGCHPGMKI